MSNLHLPLLKFSPWSVSKASLAAQCSQAFDYRYVQKLKGIPSGSESKVGTVAHRAQELVIKGTKVRDAIDQAITEDGTLTHSEAEQVRAFESAYVNFKTKLDAFAHKHPFKEIHTELKLAIDINFQPCDYDGTDCLIRGNIDVLVITESGHAIIIDHKSGKRKPIFKHQVQLDTYLLFAAAHYPGIKGFQAAIHSLAYGNEIDWAEARSREYVVTKLQPWLLSYLDKQAAGLDVIKANITPLCGWCSFRENCPEWLAHAEKRKTK